MDLHHPFPAVWYDLGYATRWACLIYHEALWGAWVGQFDAVLGPDSRFSWPAGAMGQFAARKGPGVLATMARSVPGRGGHKDFYTRGHSEAGCNPGGPRTIHGPADQGWAPEASEAIR